MKIFILSSLILLFSTYIPAQNWKWVNPSKNGNDIVFAKHFSNKIVRLAVNGDIGTSYDNGSTWTFNHASIYEYVSKVRYIDSTCIFVFCPHIVYKTDIDFLSFNSIYSTSESTTMYSDFTDANTGWVNIAIYNVFSGNTDYTFKKTIDGGLNWTVLSTTTNYNLSKNYFIFKDANIGFWNNTITQKTNNGGLNWSPTNLSNYKNIQFLGVNNIFGSFYGSSSSVIKKSLDNGNTWNNIDSFPKVNPLMVLCDSNALNICTWNQQNILPYKTYFSYSNNGGSSWTKDSINMQFTPNYVENNNTNMICAGSGGSLYESSNSGAAWTDKSNKKFYGSITALSVVSPLTSFYTLWDGRIAKSSDAGETFTFYNSNLNILNDICFPSSSLGFAVGENGTLLKTSDGGNTWNIQSIGTSENLFQIEFPTPNIGYISTYNGKIYKTSNSGTTWSLIYTFNTHTIQKMVFTSPNNGFIKANPNSAYDLIIKTTDGGLTWNNLMSFSMYSSNINISKGDSNTIYVSSYYFYPGDGTTSVDIFKYDIDGNLLYEGDTANIFKTIPIMSHAFLSDTLGYLVLSNGEIYKSIDGALTWNLETYANQVKHLFLYDTSVMYFAGNVGNIYKYDSYNVSNVEENNISKSDFIISPNPTNGYCKINCYLSNQSDVSIIVYDINGKEISNHQYPKQPSGNISYNLDMMKQSPGLYFIKLINNSQIITKKIIKL